MSDEVEPLVLTRTGAHCEHGAIRHARWEAARDHFGNHPFRRAWDHEYSGTPGPIRFDITFEGTAEPHPDGAESRSRSDE